MGKVRLYSTIQPHLMAHKIDAVHCAVQTLSTVHYNIHTPTHCNDDTAPFILYIKMTINVYNNKNNSNETNVKIRQSQYTIQRIKPVQVDIMSDDIKKLTCPFFSSCHREQKKWSV